MAYPSGARVSEFRHVGDRHVHQGYVWNVVVAEFEAPDGSTFERDIVRSPGAVGIVPLAFDAEGQPSVVLVSQYRPPYERELIEIPAGMRDVEGEPAEVARARERGYASTSGHLQPGASGIAAGFVAPGPLAASVGVVAMGELDEERVAGLVRAAARRLAELSRT